MIKHRIIVPRNVFYYYTSVARQFKSNIDMEDISDVFVTEYIPTIYTNPRTIYYKQNGVQKKFSILSERNGVVIIVYNSTKDALVLVKQFRPSVYLQQIPESERFGKIDVKKYPAKLGITLEFCAGLEDKNNVSTEKIAQEEILEECGYDVPLEKLERIGTIRNLSDTTGARTTLFYSEVTEDMRVNSGGGEVGENIELLEMPVSEVMEYATASYVQSPANFLYGFYWFLFNKLKQLK